MKLHFESDLDYQLAAIEAVCDLFRGQETCRTEFTVIRDPADAQQRMGFAENDLGIGNRLTLLDDEMLKNLNAIQPRNGLPPSGSLASGDFTVEKEKRLAPQGIKVLSLFFVDVVDRYRKYDSEGNAVRGDYAVIFEDEYSRLARHPDERWSPG